MAFGILRLAGESFHPTGRGAWSGAFMRPSQDGCFHRGGANMALCPSCNEGPSGQAGHGALGYYVEGPYPGHHIFQCSHCNERWIRHYGSETERFAWTRYVTQFMMRVPRPDDASFSLPARALRGI